MRIDWQTERRLTEVQDKGHRDEVQPTTQHSATHAYIHCVQQRMILCQSPPAAAVYVLAVLNVAAVFCRSSRIAAGAYRPACARTTTVHYTACIRLL